MTLSQIENFVLVAHDLSYSSVAEKAYVSRQAIARSIHELEKELGIILFQTDRTNRLCMTESGGMLLPEFEKVLEQTRAIKQLAEEYRHQADPVRVAFSDSIAVFIFQDIIGMLYNIHEQNPSMVSEVNQISNLELSQGMQMDADMILMLGKPFEAEGYTTEVLKSIPAVISIPYTSPLYGKNPLVREDLRGKTLICPVLPQDELQGLAGKHEIKLLPMSNFYASSYASIQNSYLILDVPFPSSDQTIIQKSVEGFSFSWELLLLTRKDCSNTNIPLLKKQIQKLLKP